LARRPGTGKENPNVRLDARLVSGLALDADSEAGLSPSGLTVDAIVFISTSKVMRTAAQTSQQ
jgi:hypothetical protein